MTRITDERLKELRFTYSNLVDINRALTELIERRAATMAEHGDAQQAVYGLLTKLESLRQSTPESAAMLAAPGAEAAAPCVAVQDTPSMLRRAALDLLTAVDRQHDSKGEPLKYTVHWGALNDLRAAVHETPSGEPQSNLPTSDEPQALPPPGVRMASNYIGYLYRLSHQLPAISASAVRNAAACMDALRVELYRVQNGQPEAPAVPAAVEHLGQPRGDWRRGYEDGWNDCRARMLKAVPTAPAVEAPPKMTDRELREVAWGHVVGPEPTYAICRAIESARDEQWRAALGGKV